MDMEILSHAPEQKAGVPAEPYQHDDLMRIFEAYKQTNDERLAQIERRRVDPLLEEKVARIDAALDSVLVRQARPVLASERANPQGAREHKAAFDSYVRSRRKRGPARAGNQGDVGRLGAGRRIPCARRGRDRDWPAPRLDLADPLHRGRARDFRQRLQKAVHDRRPGGRLGRRDGRAFADHVADARRAAASRRWSSTPCRPRPRRCWRIPRSTSTSGSPRRSSRCSPRRRAPPSSTATAPTSRRASCNYTIDCRELLGLDQDRLRGDGRGRGFRR